MTHEGPIPGSALFASRTPTRDSENPRPPTLNRRQIGLGTRAIIVTNPAHTASRRVTALPMKRGTKMKRTTMYVSLAGALMFSAAAFGISSAVDTPRTLMSRGDYGVAKQAIETETRIALSACRSVEGTTRDICKAQARAGERVKKADLDARYHGTVSAAADAKLARAKAHYDVARAKCGTQPNEQRVDCLQQARAEKSRELADAKLASI